MIVLFTDFGLAGPYVGQMHAVLTEQTPDVPVIDLMHDAPRFNPKASGYLLTALAPYMPENAVCVAVVDPGVGTDRRPIACLVGKRWFVGPDNGLFAVLPTIYEDIEWFEITWRPEKISASFHGRDLFAPVGAALARDNAQHMLSRIDALPASPPELDEIIYIDGFGNAMTGLKTASLNAKTVLCVDGQVFQPAITFGSHSKGTAIWYGNSCGLAELSVTEGSAMNGFQLSIGNKVDQRVL